MDQSPIVRTRALTKTEQAEACTLSRQQNTITDTGVNLYITLGRTDIEKIGESASAEGAKMRLPKARSPSRLGGLRERRKPQKPTRFLTFYAKKGVHFWIC